MDVRDIGTINTLVLGWITAGVFHLLHMLGAIEGNIHVEKSTMEIGHTYGTYAQTQMEKGLTLMQETLQQAV